MTKCEFVQPSSLARAVMVSPKAGMEPLIFSPMALAHSLAEAVRMAYRVCSTEIVSPSPMLMEEPSGGTE